MHTTATATTIGPIPHLIDATNALTDALHSLGADPTPAVWQDSTEWLAEVQDLTRVLHTRLSSPDHLGATAPG